MGESYWSEVGDSNGNYFISKGDRALVGMQLVCLNYQAANQNTWVQMPGVDGSCAIFFKYLRETGGKTIS